VIVLCQGRFWCAGMPLGSRFGGSGLMGVEELALGGANHLALGGGSAMNDRAPPPFAAEHGARRAPIPVWAIHAYQWR